MTDSSRRFIFYHAPQSRSAGVLALVEELDADHELRLLDLQAGTNRQPDFLAVNPLGKVPTIVHNGAVVTEQVAVYQYLAELYPEKGLAPAVGHPLRGPFLRWMAFYGSSFEPAVVDRAQRREPAPPSTCPYGSFDAMFSALTAQLARGPYLLGETYTAADVLWGSALRWVSMFKLIPEDPAVKAYVQRVCARPAFARAAEREAGFLKSLGRAAPDSA